MKFLYYASYLLSAPFYILSWICVAPTWVLCWIGDTVHEATTVKAWKVLHRRRCAADAGKGVGRP